MSSSQPNTVLWSVSINVLERAELIRKSESHAPGKRDLTNWKLIAGWFDWSMQYWMLSLSSYSIIFEISCLFVCIFIQSG